VYFTTLKVRQKIKLRMLRQSVNDEVQMIIKESAITSGAPWNFVGGSTNTVEDREQRERGSGGGSPLVRGSGGSRNLVQEISFHIVNFS
jgi:hypothetical protein